MSAARLSNTVSTSRRPLAASVDPLDTRSQIMSARPSLGAISTAPFCGTISAGMPRSASQRASDAGIARRDPPAADRLDSAPVEAFGHGDREAATPEVERKHFLERRPGAAVGESPRLFSAMTFWPTMPRSQASSWTSPGMSSSRTKRMSSGRFSPKQTSWSRARLKRSPQRARRSRELSVSRPDFWIAILRRGVLSRVTDGRRRDAPRRWSSRHVRRAGSGPRARSS